MQEKLVVGGAVAKNVLKRAKALDRIMRDRSKWTNDTLYMSEIVDSLEPTHPLHLLYNRTVIRYDYGSTYHNYCELRRRPENSLPSLLRVMEMKVITQTFLRAIVLTGLLFKATITLFILRIIGLGVFAISAAAVYETYLAYLTLKPCHTNVSISAAISEYLCISVVVLFALSQICDYRGLVMNLVAMRCDTLPREDLPDYSPAFMTSKFNSAPFAQLRRRNFHCNDLKSSSSS
ncbi:unnamed protein product [Haemonchus placei]|uniref:Transmembrane protein n=1 Tax=Haemonchus placei TaxID=6290 RepID=A0A158QN43_HAEPC|nr:unnamed protein product [Haemonchus placei]